MSKEKKKKPLKIKVSLRLLERIAEYYEFPLAVFLFPDTKPFPKIKTRNEAIFEKCLLFDRIKDIIEEYKK